MKYIIALMLTMSILHGDELDNGCRDILAKQYTQKALVVGGYVVAYLNMTKNQDTDSVGVVEDVCSKALGGGLGIIEYINLSTEDYFRRTIKY